MSGTEVVTDNIRVGGPPPGPGEMPWHMGPDLPGPDPMQPLNPLMFAVAAIAVPPLSIRESGMERVLRGTGYTIEIEVLPDISFDWIRAGITHSDSTWEETPTYKRNPAEPVTFSYPTLSGTIAGVEKIEVFYAKVPGGMFERSAGISEIEVI